MQIGLLKADDVKGSNMLESFKILGLRAFVSDYAMMLGAHHIYLECKDASNSYIDRAGWYWIDDIAIDKGSVTGVDYQSVMYKYNPILRLGGVRPVIKYSSVSDYINKDLKKYKNGVVKVNFGEYPQSAVSKNLNDILEDKYNNAPLKPTGKIYSYDDNMFDDFEAVFNKKEFFEYEYEGDKYIRVESNYNNSKVTLSNGFTPTVMQWIKVEPLVWLVDVDKDKMVCEEIILSGIQFNELGKTTTTFEKTNMYKYLNKYFVNEFISESIDKSNNDINEWDFNYNDMSEEDIIRGAIESNIPVFLHGKSSDGKSSRVKQIDKDCQIVYLRNATPDSLNGKSVYNSETGEMIDVAPTWYKKIKEKCEKEPNKLHILFFDELTNALPSIQGMAFNIILDREVNGIWKLPDNCRIVAAGNDLNDSLAANEMAEPLFNRFAHVYIDTKEDDWLVWAIKNNIHPSIIRFIVYRKKMGSSVLRKDFTGDKPNADPRKWEMASKMLYKVNNPYVLRSLIGEDLTMDFVRFTKRYYHSIEDVINGNYSEYDQKLSINEKYITMLGLCNVNAENVGKVREFVRFLDEKLLNDFDKLWSFDNEERKQILNELDNSVKKKNNNIR